ncbi:ABC transporter ATP-binding protein [Arcanobacterium ihumii]|uniref:ABC transporter ATP-binding protein n=1 Tax=Arcanobacterium ihumii TaxID=2138162 RepID=UPI00190F131C|nr:ABC transporter ATP-binding protein [Arcanobacterium ihumii]
MRELITFGRYPYTGAFASLTKDDHRVIEDAAAATQVLDYLDRPATQLSGGQRQRMWIAMILAQQSSIMLLDEPTTFLDPANQLSILDLVTDLNREGRTIVMVVHDMVHAAKYSDHVVVMKNGEILKSGPTEETLNSDLIERAFGISTMMVADPQTGRKLPLAYSVCH